jgi:hypothetical protein
MNVKRSLENRIRGWLPHEPTMISTRLKVNHELEQPPPIIPPDNKVSYTKIFGVYAILIIVVYGFMAFFTTFDQGRNPISLFQSVIWIIIGLAFGVISSLIETKYQLSRVSKAYKFTTNRKDYVLIYVPAILFAIFSYFIGSFLHSSLPQWSISMYTWGISLLITRIILFVSFERKENMRLITSWWGGSTVFLVPKPPTSNSNYSDTMPNKNFQV